MIQDWGLVEYNSAEEAETTMDALRDAMLDETKIRVQYCIPNIHAINIYMSFVNNPLDNRYYSQSIAAPLNNNYLQGWEEGFNGRLSQQRCL